MQQTLICLPLAPVTIVMNVSIGVHCCSIDFSVTFVYRISIANVHKM